MCSTPDLFNNLEDAGEYTKLILDGVNALLVRRKQLDGRIRYQIDVDVIIYEKISQIRKQTTYFCVL